MQSLGGGFEHSESQFLLHVGTVLQLHGVVEGRGVVRGYLPTKSLREVVGGEDVDGDEGCELRTVA